LVGAALLAQAFKRGGVPPDVRERWPELCFLACAFLLFLALQLRFSSFVYDGFPPLQFLQFPWRLLVYITVLGLLLVVAGLDLLVRKPRWLGLLAVFWTGSFLVLSPLMSGRDGAPFLAQDTVDDMLIHHAPGWTGTVLQGQGEYTPRVLNGQGQELSATETLGVFRKLHDDGKQLQVQSGSCQVQELEPTRKGEVSTLSFEYRCLSQSEVALPVSYNRLMLVEDTTTKNSLAYHRLPNDPRVRVHIKAGHGRLLVRLPSTATMARLLRLKLAGD
ncbi:MAG: hypothetical protein ABWY01_04435, partial [Pseudoxanthomonas sp.]